MSGVKGVNAALSARAMVARLPKLYGQTPLAFRIVTSIDQVSDRPTKSHVYKACKLFNTLELRMRV